MVKDSEIVPKQSGAEGKLGAAESPVALVPLSGKQSSGQRHERNSGASFKESLASDSDSLMQVHELQCAACNQLLQNPYHAPCGHSFCQSHLALKEDPEHELDRSAATLRRLCEDLGFSMPRAKEAYAWSPKDSAKAEERCREISSLEGRVVRVRPDVIEPTFNWGMITPDSVGRIFSIEDGHCRVDFPQSSGWHCLLQELEVDEVADKVRVGAIVRVRAGVEPGLGWGVLEGDDTGIVVMVSQARCIVQGRCRLWYGFVGELECVSEPELVNYHGNSEVMDSIFRRLRCSKGKTASGASGICRATLGAILKSAASCVDGSGRVMLRGERRKAIMHTPGAMDLLRWVGYEVAKWDPFRFRTLIVAGGEKLALAERATTALEALIASFGACPEVTADDKRFAVVISVDREELKRWRWEKYWEELREKLLQAMAPTGLDSSFSWGLKGWASEEALEAQLKEHLPKGAVRVARGQPQREARQIMSSLLSQGLSVRIVDDGVAQGENPCLGEDPSELSYTDTWEGSVPRGARVRLLKVAEDRTDGLTSSSIGVVGAQFRHSTEGLKLIVNFPVVVSEIVGADAVQLDVEADKIQPGVRVKIKKGVEPKFGMQGVEYSDVGVVHAVRFDGTVLVYVPWIDDLFRATLSELDTTGLPTIVQGSCPVCDEPLVLGEHLATDMAVQAQVERLRRAMESNPSELNSVVGSAPRLDRSLTHKGELTCSICLDLMVAPVTLGCGHSFCKAHIEAWLLEHNSCPNCKHRVMVHRQRSLKSKAVQTYMFEVEIRDDEDRPAEEAAQEVKAKDFPVNEMLAKQIKRHFLAELEGRKAEVAGEAWDALQSRSNGYLPTLRHFLRQFDADAVGQLVKQGLADVNTRLPSTRGATLLMLAAELGLEGAIQELLARKADPLLVRNTTSDFACTALSLAAGRGHESALRLLLAAAQWPVDRLADALGCAIEQQKFACIAVLLSASEGLANVPNVFGYTASLVAVQTNSTEALKVLLEQGQARVDANLSKGILASGARVDSVNGIYQLFGLCKGKPYYQNTSGAVIYFHDWWKIGSKRADLGKGWVYSMPEPRSDCPTPPRGEWTTFGHGAFAMPAPRIDHLGAGCAGTCEPSGSTRTLTALLLSAQMGLAEVAAILLEALADPCTRVASTGETVLQIASSRGDLSMTQLLLSCRASISDSNRQGLTAIHVACAAGHDLIVAELLKSQAFAESETVPTPLMLAASCGRYPPKPGARVLANCVVEKFASAVECLLAARAEPNRFDGTGTSALHMAAVTGANEQMLKNLIDAGARTDVIDFEGRSPFFAALLSCQSAAACALLKFGDPRELLIGEYKTLRPLNAAALLGDLGLVKRLLPLVSDPSALVAGADAEAVVARLTCDGLAPHCWQVILEPPLTNIVTEALMQELSAAEQRLQVGDRVVLTPGYAALGHAARGPLKPGGVGRIVKIDAGKVPFQVEANGHKFWYRAGALCKHNVCPREGPDEWKGHVTHPQIGDGNTVLLSVRLTSSNEGVIRYLDRECSITMVQREGILFRFRETEDSAASGLEFDGECDERAFIRGAVGKDGVRTGTFLMIPADQDVTVRCPRGHPAERMSPYSVRSATCDVCGKPIKRTQPLYFTCRSCNYDACAGCSGTPLFARLPIERPLGLRSLTPLHCAAAAGQGDVVLELLNARADFMAIDINGQTPLHWAAAGGHGWALEALLLAGGERLAAVTDAYGSVALGFAPDEMLRYTCGDGQLLGFAIEVGRATASAGVPGESGVAGIYKLDGQRDGRPNYRRHDLPGWSVCWDNKSARWGLYRERYDAGCIQYQSKQDTQRCPTSGWEPVVAQAPVPAFEEILPWRAARLLLDASPVTVVPKVTALKQIVNSLPPLPAPETASTVITVGVGSETATITLPPGAPPIEVIIQELIRRGDLPAEPPAGCIQQ